MEKIFRCGVCQRPIGHRGNCFPCNKRLKASSAAQAGHPEEKLSEENPAVKFPYASVRESQSDMMADVRVAIESRRHLLADAPTGLGKTIASLFPSVDYATKNGKTVFFLTSRLSQHRAAIEALRKMKESGAKFSAVDIIGKRHLCSQDIGDMDSGMFSSFCSSMIKHRRCAYYKNFHRSDLSLDRANILRLMWDKGPLNSGEAKKLSSARFCTFEMLMEAGKDADVVIGDYFHIFGNETILKRMGKKIEDIIIIVDEGHNLSSRLRSHLSSKLSTRTCELAAKEAGKFVEQESKSIARQLEKHIEDIGKKFLFNKQEVFIGKDDLIGRMANYDLLAAKLCETGERVLKERKISFSARIAEFLMLWKKDDFGYARILSRERFQGQDHIMLQFNCLDPSLIAKSIIEKSHSTIVMSGTLSPLEMHRDLLGMQPGRTDMKDYPSPFPKENRKNIIASGMTTRYSKRTADNFASMATTTRLCLESIRGNAAVFFPSYEMRNHIHDLISPVMKKHIILEESSMTKEERDQIREEMRKHAKQGAVLFGVMGGSFSEGIDLPGDLLNGVIIIGLPLERPNLSSQALIDYYEKRFRRGRDYGYNYPAMIKVMQAAGRCIRTEKDRGVIVFADERFTWKNYREIFPKTWDFTVTQRPELEVRRFFGQVKE